MDDPGVVARLVVSEAGLFFEDEDAEVGGFELNLIGTSKAYNPSADHNQIKDRFFHCRFYTRTFIASRLAANLEKVCTVKAGNHAQFLGVCGGRGHRLGLWEAVCSVIDAALERKIARALVWAMGRRDALTCRYLSTQAGDCGWIAKFHGPKCNLGRGRQAFCPKFCNFHP